MHSGGVLNTFNRAYKLTQIRHTVSCTELSEKHRPTSEVELVMLIAEHLPEMGPCTTCTAVTQNNGLEGWAKRMFNKVKWFRERGGDPNHPNLTVDMFKDTTYNDCYSFMYALNVRNTILGKGIMEPKAVQQLQHAFPNHNIVSAPENIDRDYAVDVIIHDIIGVQVKPTSYKNRTELHAENLRRNTLWGKPVVYLYYNRTREEFVNFEDVVHDVANALMVADPLTRRPRKRTFLDIQREASEAQTRLALFS